MAKLNKKTIMELKKAKMHMLPTEDKSEISCGNTGKGLIHHASLMPDYSNRTYQHLYLTIDEKIEEGDWGIQFNDINTKAIETFQWNYVTSPAPEAICRKIIATTDLKLWQHSMHSEGKVKVALPQLPQKFIKEYCKVGGIDEVMVEYEQWCPNCGNDNCDRRDCREFDDKTIIKVYSNNNIIIHSIKKKSWNREEVEELIHEYSKYTYDKYQEDLEIRNKWLKDNL